MKLRRVISLAITWGLLAGAQAALACATCYGQSDSSLAKGMNMGILALLGFIGLVLGGVASFFVFIIRRAASVQTAAGAAPKAN
jgi:hypothetical protein